MRQRRTGAGLRSESTNKAIPKRSWFRCTFSTITAASKLGLPAVARGQKLVVLVGGRRAVRPATSDQTGCLTRTATASAAYFQADGAAQSELIVEKLDAGGSFEPVVVRCLRCGLVCRLRSRSGTSWFRSDGSLDIAPVSTMAATKACWVCLRFAVKADVSE